MNPTEAMTAFNYFNYFTEIEEYFWQKRGAHLLVSPLDWAIVETWQKAGISLPAVLKGIDRAFENYARSRRAAGGRQLKSLAYCVDAVLDAAQEEKETAAGTGPSVPRKAKAEESFSREELRSFFNRNMERISTAVSAFNAQNSGTTVSQALLLNSGASYGSSYGGAYLQSWPSNLPHYKFQFDPSNPGTLQVEVAPAGNVTSGSATWVPYTGPSSCNSVL